MSVGENKCDILIRRVNMNEEKYVKSNQCYDNVMASLKEKIREERGSSERNFKHQTMKMGMISQKDYRCMGTSNR